MALTITILSIKWREILYYLGSYLEPLCLVGDTSEVPDPLTWDKVVNLILGLVGDHYLLVRWINFGRHV